jgi:hypothetical protein
VDDVLFHDEHDDRRGGVRAQKGVHGPQDRQRENDEADDLVLRVAVRIQRDERDDAADDRERRTCTRGAAGTILFGPRTVAPAAARLGECDPERREHQLGEAQEDAVDDQSHGHVGEPRGVEDVGARRPAAGGTAGLAGMPAPPGCPRWRSLGTVNTLENHSTSWLPRSTQGAWLAKARSTPKPDLPEPNPAGGRGGGGRGGGGGDNGGGGGGGGGGGSVMTSSPSSST